MAPKLILRQGLNRLYPEQLLPLYLELLELIVHKNHSAILEEDFPRK